MTTIWYMCAPSNGERTIMLHADVPMEHGLAARVWDALFNAGMEMLSSRP